MDTADDPLGGVSDSGSAAAPSIQATMDAMRLALDQGGAIPTVGEVNALLQQCTKQQVSSETVTKVEQILGALKSRGFPMKQVKAAWLALKGTETRKPEGQAATSTKPSAGSTMVYSPALGINIPSTRPKTRPKSTKATHPPAGRHKAPKAAIGETVVNEAGFKQGDKVVFAPFCPHRDRGLGTVLYASHSGICVAFGSQGSGDAAQPEEWVHNEIVARPGAARASAARKSGARAEETSASRVGAAPSQLRVTDDDTL